MVRPSSARAAVRAARNPAGSCADNPAANNTSPDLRSRRCSVGRWPAAQTREARQPDDPAVRRSATEQLLPERRGQPRFVLVRRPALDLDELAVELGKRQRIEHGSRPGDVETEREVVGQ